MATQRISRREVENFKSLVNFEMDLPKFSCLIGLNGAGKSTVLKFTGFLSQLVRGDMKGWLAEQKWQPADLKSKLTKKVNITHCVSFCDEQGKPVGRWKAVYSPSKNRCTRERIDLRDFVLMTTSPMILNFLEDDVARKGVIYLYKTAMGVTKPIPFFSIPSVQKKLDFMGPGEAFVDTNLTELADEIADLTAELTMAGA